jgi:hypothetical protein
VCGLCTYKEGLSNYFNFFAGVSSFHIRHWNKFFVGFQRKKFRSKK